MASADDGEDAHESNGDENDRGDPENLADDDQEEDNNPGAKEEDDDAAEEQDEKKEAAESDAEDDGDNADEEQDAHDEASKSDAEEGGDDAVAEKDVQDKDQDSDAELQDVPEQAADSDADEEEEAADDEQNVEDAEESKSKPIDDPGASIKGTVTETSSAKLKVRINPKARMVGCPQKQKMTTFASERTDRKWYKAAEKGRATAGSDTLEALLDSLDQAKPGLMEKQKRLSSVLVK
ncbi:hypothetical protein JG688_00017255 [Phytophthora aleatoria]|uniref:Uncharacterized protein n=1 Tax=Phytophthora aleatoria TaxID=2496075 RepID=A0A8J5IQX5_9STRA|nr:hypothetical protein JG688_00017255 [Phytophthora aleatoria]